MSKLSRRPGKDPKAVNDFISEAETSPPKETAKTPEPERAAYPWENPLLRDDVAKGFNLRLPERYLEKLRYIAANTPPSMQFFALEALKKAIDQKIEELTGEGGNR